MSAEHVYIRVRSADCRLLSGACAGHADRKFRIEVRNRIFVRCPPEGLRSAILMKSMAVEFVRRFASTKINKILTIEASGIAPAIMVGYLLELPVVFAKKKKPSTMENMLTTTVYSFTKDRSYEVCVSSDYLCPGDKVLFIDDFLANGNAAKGIIDLVQKAGAELVGMGFLIEKSFQHGGDYLRAQGIHVESLAIIESLDHCEIKIKE